MTSQVEPYTSASIPFLITPAHPLPKRRRKKPNPIAMAAKDPSYLNTTTLLNQEIQQKELRFKLYLFQHTQGEPDRNERAVSSLHAPHDFGSIVVHDWTIRDGPNLQDKIVGRAQGLHLGAGMNETNWFTSFNIIFTDERFKGSTLQVLGTTSIRDGEWAITGGTGEFAFAQGVATHIKSKERGAAGRDWELRIRAMCLTFPKPDVVPLHICVEVLVTKIGPWGGNGGKEFGILESVPQHLESVTIRSRVVIDSIAFSYIDQAGKKQTLGPWGGDGELTDTITFAPLEIVKEVSGTTGTFGGDAVVTSLTLVTNVRTYGPFGKPSGTAFSVPLTDTSIVGFFAHAGRLVNAIGVYARPSVQNY